MSREFRQKLTPGGKPGHPISMVLRFVAKQVDFILKAASGVSESVTNRYIRIGVGRNLFRIASCDDVVTRNRQLNAHMIRAAFVVVAVRFFH